MASTSTDCETSEREFIALLIELYRDCPELWKVKSKDYFNRNKKSAAFEKIVAALNVLKPGFTVKLLKAKINVLRTNFNREYNAIQGKILSGMSTDVIPQPSLWYYHDLYFIKDQMEIAGTVKYEPPIPDVNSQSLQDPGPSKIFAMPTLNPAPHTHKKSGNKRKGVDTTEQLMGLATEYFKRPETEEDIIAKGWAMKLKKLPPDQRSFAEKIINDTLFEAQMCTLTREGVRFVRAWTPSSSPSSMSTFSPKQEYEMRPSPDQAQNEENENAAYYSSYNSM